MFNVVACGVSPLQTPDTAHEHANALYYNTRRNRAKGCNKETLRRLLAFDTEAYNASASTLVARGWITEDGDDVSLTTDGWKGVLDSRRHKTHAAVCFTAAEEQPVGVGSHAYRFTYLFRDSLCRQYNHTVTVTITDELCRRWQSRELGSRTNVPDLKRLLRRLAFDHVARHLVANTLQVHEQLSVGGLVGTLPRRYQTRDLPETEQEDHEVEWQHDRRA